VTLKYVESVITGTCASYLAKKLRILHVMQDSANKDSYRSHCYREFTSASHDMDQVIAFGSPTIKRFNLTDTKNCEVAVCFYQGHI
jgi:hypothetical protein